MRFNLQLLSLPASILLLIASQASTAVSTTDDQSTSQWPHDLPPHVKFWAEDPPNRRRDLEAVEEHLRMGRSPVGVMKMPADEGEKFYMEYWQFEGELGQTNPSAMLRRRDEEERLNANVSAAMDYRPPFLLHTKTWEESRRESARALAALQKRDFVCPTGTAACTNIGFSESCCTVGDTCYQIPESGLGQVGCCPAGATCGGTITHCDAPNTPCSVALGGGCCIPNYVCVEGGCALNSSLIVTAVITQTITAIGALPSTITSTSLSTITSATSSTSACPLNVQSCPASLGGGCCPTDRVCAASSCAPIPPSSTTTVVSTSIITTTSSATGTVPVRPINSTSTSDASTTTTTSAVATACPTGFYGCEAFYQGGCCRTGRDCQKTSCPPIASTTLLSNGATVIVPTGPAALLASPTGTCASGWSTCPPSVGGNCCPSGWGCGTASCSSVAASTTAVAQKASPGGAGRTDGEWSLLLIAGSFTLGLLMI